MPTSANTESVRLLVKIDGKEEIKATGTGSTWKTTSGANVVTLVVDQKLDAPDAFMLQFLSTHEGQRTVFDNVKEGSQIELGFGYDTPEVLFKGEVVYVDAEYSADGDTPSLVTIRGYDKTHRLTRGHSAKSFGDGAADMDAGGPVGDIFSGSQAGLGNVSDALSAPENASNPTYKTRWVPRPTSTSYDFLKGQGAGRKLDINSSPVATLCFDRFEGNNPLKAVKIRFSVSTFPSYSKVRVRGWNPNTKKGFIAEVDKCSSEIDCGAANSWTPGWQRTGTAMYGSSSSGSVYDRNAEFCESKEEAQQIAQSIFDQMSLKHLTGECEVQGDPKLIPGAVVEVKGFGPRVSGKVLITEATHTISALGQPYLCSLKFASNASGNGQ